MSDDTRLIEDYLPIEAISAEASREKSVRKGHISTLHLWWARRPLVACRAAVYGALVPANRWVKDIDLKNPPADAAKAEAIKNSVKRGLNRKAAQEFVTKLCRYPKTNPTKPEDIKIKRETQAAIVEAQRHILEAHAERLTAELAEASKTGKMPPWVEEFKFQGDTVSYDDIVAGRAPRPRVLDMFAGGGSIPLEALRLGCEAYALDLNPVAQIIELCTLVYPQKYGKPDPTAQGMTGPKNANGESTWGGLAAEVRYLGNWVFDRIRKEIGDLYPPIPDPAVWKTPPEITFDRETGEWNKSKPGKLKRGLRFGALNARPTKRPEMYEEEEDEDDEDEVATPPVGIPPGFLVPVAYLWTRTIRCKNPGCGATVPLVRQTWVCRKKDYYVAMQPFLVKTRRSVRFEVREATTEEKLGFDPSDFSHAGNATCPFCSTVSDIKYVKDEGWHGRMGRQPMALIAVRPGEKGKVYLAPEAHESSWPNQGSLATRMTRIGERFGITVPNERIANLPDPCSDNSLGITVRPYGIRHFGDLFTDRQAGCLIAFATAIRDVAEELEKLNDRAGFCS